MSYARFGPASDVYVYMDVHGYLACCGCRLGDQWHFDSTEAMVAHLADHDEAGHLVPDIVDDLRAEDRENFPPTCRDGHEPGEPYRPYAENPELHFIQRADCIACGWVLPVPFSPTTPTTDPEEPSA